MRHIILRNQQRQQLKIDRSVNKQLNVVITGGTRGLGRALAQEFSNHGDNVFILSRSQHVIESLITSHKNIQGCQCDMSNRQDVKNGLDGVINTFGNVDVWINNAGISGGSRKLLELTEENLENIIKTNLLGTAIACQQVFPVMNRQLTGGAIFNLAGAGSDGSATPNYSVYGATKAGIVQFSKTLQREWKETNVDMHVISPGMMFTDLLMDNIHIDTMDMIEFLCAYPELVAYHLVPRIKRAYYYHEDSHIRFLTFFKVFGKMLTYNFYKNKSK